MQRGESGHFETVSSVGETVRAFVPNPLPPPHSVDTCMGQIEVFLHRSDDGLPTLVRAALAYVRFETVHPFLDGNGRPCGSSTLGARERVFSYTRYTGVEARVHVT